MVTNSVLLHSFMGCEHFDHDLTWHHCLFFLAKNMFFLAVPLQFGCSEPRGVPQHGAILRFVVKALGSVKHEGPTTSKQQIGVICEALNTEAFTSFCRAYDGAICSGLLGHCLQPPHCVEGSTVFTSLSFALGCILATFSSFFRDDLFAGDPETFFLKYLLAKAASCREFEVLVVDIGVAFMHARTDEEIFVKVPSGIKGSKFLRLKAAVNGTRTASKHLQEYSSDKLVTNLIFQQNDLNPCVYKRFSDNLDLEQHGDDFSCLRIILRFGNFGRRIQDFSFEKC